MKRETPLCQKKVFKNWSHHACWKKVWKDGFCKKHHPETVEKLAQKRDAKYAEHQAKMYADIAAKKEKDRRAEAYPRLVAALRSVIAAASADKVEDFSAVSNAADNADAILRELGEGK